MDNQNEQLYKFKQASLKVYRNKYKLTYFKAAVRQKGFEIENYKRTGVNEEKLDDNLTRAKSKIFEYGMCNDWDYFCTLTVDPSRYDRKNLSKYQKDLAKWINNQNRLKGYKLKYLLIPEMHKDGAWHMHGFIAGLPPGEIKINEHGYWDWQAYKDKFGWISLDKIRNQEKASRYITKYIKKDLKDRKKDLNAHLYYCSRGLKVAEELKKGTISCDDIMPTDFENEHVKIKWSVDPYKLAELFD